MKVLVINDPHLAASPPRGCTPVYVDDVKNMLLECRDIVRDEDIEVTLFTGDMFHIKRQVPHALVRWLIETLHEWRGTKLAIVGNHDLTERGIVSVQTQPIGVVFASGALRWLEDDYVGWWCVDKDRAGGDVVWVQFSPANYFDQIDDDPANFGLNRYTPVYEDEPKNIDWAIKVAHGSLVAPGREYPFACVPMDKVPTEGMDVCLFGHLHHNSGIKEVNGCWFAGLGSLGRVANAEYNRERQVEVLIMDISKEEIQFERRVLKSQASPAELFLPNTLADVEIDDSMRKFARNMERALAVEETPLESVLAEVSATGVPKPVQDRVRLRLEEAGL